MSTLTILRNPLFVEYFSTIVLFGKYRLVQGGVDQYKVKLQVSPLDSSKLQYP